MTDEELAKYTFDKADEVPGTKRLRRTRNPLYTEIAKRALADPGSWVVVHGFADTAVASHMRKGRYAAIDPDDHDIEIRKQKDGTYSLYVKYTGNVVEND